MFSVITNTWESSNLRYSLVSLNGDTIPTDSAVKLSLTIQPLKSAGDADSVKLIGLTIAIPVGTGAGDFTSDSETISANYTLGGNHGKIAIAYDSNQSVVSLYPASVNYPIVINNHYSLTISVSGVSNHEAGRVALTVIEKSVLSGSAEEEAAAIKALRQPCELVQNCPGVLIFITKVSKNLNMSLQCDSVYIKPEKTDKLSCEVSSDYFLLGDEFRLSKPNQLDDELGDYSQLTNDDSKKLTGSVIAQLPEVDLNVPKVTDAEYQLFHYVKLVHLSQEPDTYKYYKVPYDNPVDPFAGEANILLKVVNFAFNEVNYFIPNSTPEIIGDQGHLQVMQSETIGVRFSIAQHWWICIEKICVKVIDAARTVGEKTIQKTEASHLDEDHFYSIEEIKMNFSGSQSCELSLQATLIFGNNDQLTFDTLSPCSVSYLGDLTIDGFSVEREKLVLYEKLTWGKFPYNILLGCYFNYSFAINKHTTHKVDVKFAYTHASNSTVSYELINDKKINPKEYKGKFRPDASGGVNLTAVPYNRQGVAMQELPLSRQVAIKVYLFRLYMPLVENQNKNFWLMSRLVSEEHCNNDTKEYVLGRVGSGFYEKRPCLHNYGETLYPENSSNNKTLSYWVVNRCSDESDKKISLQSIVSVKCSNKDAYLYLSHYSDKAWPLLLMKEDGGAPDQIDRSWEIGDANWPVSPKSNHEGKLFTLKNDKGLLGFKGSKAAQLNASDYAKAHEKTFADLVYLNENESKWQGPSTAWVADTSGEVTHPDPVVKFDSTLTAAPQSLFASHLAQPLSVVENTAEQSGNNVSSEVKNDCCVTC